MGGFRSTYVFSYNHNITRHNPVADSGCKALYIMFSLKPGHHHNIDSRLHAERRVIFTGRSFDITIKK